MKHHRERLEVLIQQQLGLILLRDYEFDGAMVTIASVEGGEPLESVKVKVSVWPPEKGPDVLVKLLTAAPKLQWLLLRKLHIRLIPRLNFELLSESVEKTESGD